MNTSRRFHLICDGYNCDRDILKDKVFLVGLINAIAEKINMNIIDGPRVVEGMPYNPGLTIKTVIDFSSIDIHTFTNSGEFCLDVFSCKKFNYKLIYDLVKIAFQLKDKDIRAGVVDYRKLRRIEDEEVISSD